MLIYQLSSVHNVHNQMNAKLGRLEVSFSSCQRNLIKTFQIEAMIALITKIVLNNTRNKLNGQKKKTKSAKTLFSMWIFNIKNALYKKKKKIH